MVCILLVLQIMAVLVDIRILLNRVSAIMTTMYLSQADLLGYLCITIISVVAQ